MVGVPRREFVSWSSALLKPISVPGKKELTTLREAREYLLSLPDKQQNPAVQAASEAVVAAASGTGPITFAEVALRRVVNGPVELPKIRGVGFS
jgi:hypothetical protein